MAKIVVFGATGFAGSHIVTELLDRGHAVVGVSRDVSSLSPRSGLSLTQGSVYDPDFIKVVTEGADHIVVSVPADPPGLPELREVVASVLAAAAEVGARVGVVGGTGSLQAVEGGPRVLDTPEWPSEFLSTAQAHARALELLRGSDNAVDWYYVSPAAEFGAWVPGERTGGYRLGADVLLRDDAGRSHISGADLAIAFADEIETPKHHRTRFTVGY